MMAANKMAQIAALFGKKLGEEFTVRYEDKEKNGNLWVSRKLEDEK